MVNRELLKLSMLSFLFLPQIVEREVKIITIRGRQAELTSEYS